MRLGTRLDPRAKERLRRVSSSGGDEFVSRLTKGPIRTKSDRPEADVETLVLDDSIDCSLPVDHIIIPCLATLPNCARFT